MPSVRRVSRVRKARTVGGVSIAKGAKRVVTKSGGTKTVKLVNKGGTGATKTISRVAASEGHPAAKGLGLGRYARKHVTTNTDGSKTYTKRTGAQVKVAVTPSTGSGSGSGSDSGSTNSSRRARILARHESSLADGYQRGEFANIKNKSKRRMLKRSARKRGSSSNSGSGSGSGSGSNNDNS